MDGLKIPTTPQKSLFQATSVTECYNIIISHVFTGLKIHFYISLHLEWVRTIYSCFWGMHKAHEHWGIEGTEILLPLSRMSLAPRPLCANLTIAGQ